MIIDSIRINKIDIKDLKIFQSNKRLFFAMAKKDKIDFIYNTPALEGNAMTYPEVATLLDGVTIGGHKLSDEQQILNQNRSVNLLFELIEQEKFILDKDILLKLHKKVAFEEVLCWGVSRLMMNGILLSYGYPMLNIKAKDKLAFNQMMIAFYDSDDMIKSINYLLKYYIKQNKNLVN